MMIVGHGEAQVVNRLLDVEGALKKMKNVLVAHPAGARLYELSDQEYQRLDYLLQLAEPEERGAWAARFLRERVPARIYPPGTLGAEVVDELDIDRAIGGNFFTSKWGAIQHGRGRPDDD